MSSTEDTAMLPGPLVKGDNTYGGTSDSVKALNLYTWTGSLLPTTRTEYCTRLGIASVKDSLGTMTDNLLNTYKLIKTNSDNFRFTTYPDIVKIANDVYDYAFEAGGTVTDSYYATIIDLTKQLNTAATKSPPAPQADLDKIKADIREIIDYQVQKIQDIQTKADKCVTALQAYEKLCGTDKQNMENSMKAFTDKLSGASGEITAAEAQITAKRKELSDAQAEYEQDVKIAATTVTYAWCWPIGPVIAAVVAGVYADKAVRMKNLITAIKDLIASSSTQLAADKAVVSDLGFMKDDLTKVLGLIGPAITTIQKMRGDWGAISGDLGSIKTQIGKSNTVPPFVLKKTPAQVVEKWNALKTAVDVYRRNAFVTQPTVTSLSQLVTDYSKAAKAA